MKFFFSAFLTLLFVSSIFGTVLAATSDAVNDVPAGHWAYKAVNELVRVGVIDGYGNKTFQGDKTITRYEMAQVVEKAMANSNKATVVQKALIDKLAIEFALELNQIDTRVTKLENFNKSTLKVGFDTLMVGVMDNPAAGNPKLQGNDMWRWRARLLLSGDLNEDTKYDARLTTSFGTAGMSTSSTQNNLISFDRMYLTSKNVLGFDSIQLGRQSINELGGNLAYKSGGNDGITLTKKLSKDTAFKMGAFVVKPELAAVGTFSGDAQEVQFASVQSQVSPKLKIGGMFLNNNTKVITTDTPFKYSNDGSKIAGVSAAYKLGKFTLLSEYDRANLKNPVGVKSNPHAFAFQITNGTVSSTSFYPIAQTVTNINKKGDQAFVLSYRYTEKGAVPNGLGPWNGTTVTSPTYLVNGKAVGGVDNIKGWYVSYQYVVAKGMELSFDSQFLKYADTGAKFVDIYMLILNTRF